MKAPFAWTEPVYHRWEWGITVSRQDGLVFHCGPRKFGFGGSG